MRLIHFLPFLFFLVDACVDPLKVVLPASPADLVVDGLITDDPGPYQVRLFYSSRLDTVSLNHIKVESGATVQVADDQGHIESLVETAAGVYESDPDGIRGAIGRSYQLRIITSKGITYESSPQLLQPSGVIDRVYIDYKKDGIELKDSKLVDSFSVMVDAHGAPNGFYRWRWTGVYKGETFPQFRKMITRSGIVPDPEPCSGYIRNGSGISKVADCTCCICWATEVNTNSLVSDNRLSQDQTFRAVELSKLTITGMRFYEKYHLVVEQLSVSQVEYEFWKLAQAQQRSVGSLFQPNSVRVRGNISCVSNPSLVALGIFSVSGITRNTQFIDRMDVPLTIPPLDTITYNCMDELPGTTTKPDFW